MCAVNFGGACLSLAFNAKVTQCAFTMDTRYLVIRLVDNDTGELIAETKKFSSSSLFYMRSRIYNNLDSFLRYVALHPDRNVVFQVSCCVDNKSLELPFDLF